jgi:soluble lytic murein transglycosylase-like protein
MRKIWSFTKGNHCFSAGFLAFSLTGLMQPPAQPNGTPAELLPQPPGPAATVETIAAVPQEPLTATPPADPAPPPAATPQSQTQQDLQTQAQTQAQIQAIPPAEPTFPAEIRTLELQESHGIPESPFGELIYQVAGRHAVNPYLVAAIVKVESAFNPRAVSRKGACGLMQLLPATARRFGLSRRDLFDPAKNLEAGVRYLKWLAARFANDPTRVLAAYNAGEGAVERFGGVPPYRETQSYVRRIFTLLGMTAETTLPAPAAPAEMIAGR